MSRKIISIRRDSDGWSVDDRGDHHDRHLTKEEALMRARQLVLGEHKARITVQRDSGSIERDIWIGRPSIT